MPCGALRMRSAQKFLNSALTLVGIIAFGLLAAYAQDAPKQETHGINVANMDRSVKPGDNFHLYCNGDWIKRTEIPPDRSRLSVFTTLADVSDKRMDRSVKPGDNFHLYCNGDWIKRTEIPPDRSRLSVFTTLAVQ